MKSPMTLLLCLAALSTFPPQAQASEDQILYHPDCILEVPDHLFNPSVLGTLQSKGYRPIKRSNAREERRSIGLSLVHSRKEDSNHEKKCKWYRKETLSVVDQSSLTLSSSLWVERTCKSISSEYLDDILDIQREDLNMVERIAGWIYDISEERSKKDLVKKQNNVLKKALQGIAQCRVSE